MFVGGQEQILRAGLAVDLEPPGLGVADDLDRLGGGDVNQQDGHVKQLRQCDGPVGCFPHRRGWVVADRVGSAAPRDLGPIAGRSTI